MQRDSGLDTRRDTSPTPPGPGDGRTRPAAGSDGVDDSIPRSHGPFAFLLTDIEDSTVLWELDPSGMAEAVATHDRIVTAAVEGAGGRVVQRVGDAMDAAFDDVDGAVDAAIVAQRRLGDADWGDIGQLRIRMAIDVGEVDERGGKFFGRVLNRAGRMLAAGHGGQVLASAEAARRVEASDVEVRDLGEFRFKGLGRPQQVFQLVAGDLEADFPPLRVDQPPGAGPMSGYELGERVGEGRLGVVHRGVQPSSGREVAIKAVRRELVNDPWFVRRFEAEARIVARLDHVHLVGLRDFWRDPDGAFVVTPWLDGGSLDEALEGRPWDLGRAARLVSQVGSALVFLHDRGLKHGGVKPSNVLLDAEGDAFLADAWLATRLVHAPANDLHTAADDLQGLALVVVAVLTGGWPAGSVRPPSVSEMRPEVDGEIDSEIAAAISADAPLEEGAVRDFLDVVLPMLGAGTEIAERVRNPYKGLEAFGEADAADFFGREDLLATLMGAVAEAPLVAVVGPSGSGKSSLVRAGLLPAVHRGDLGGDWLVTDMVPGGRPFEALEAALLRVAVERPDGLADALRSGPQGFRRAVHEVLPEDGMRLLVVVDQFEELFALVEDEGERQRFLDGLVALAEDGSGRTRVVVTLRADFFDRPLDYPEFGELLKDGLVAVTPLGGERLAAAVEGPARNVGVEVEAALVSQIVGDVGEEPGRLPLVQFTMTELFDRCEGPTLTLDAYRDAGGVTGALARRAESVYGELPAGAGEAARQVFLRLVALGEGAEDTRRRVPRDRLVSLVGQAALVELVLDRFGENRLLAFDRDATTREPTVEVAHEALLRHWPRLRGWVDEARDHLRQHRRLRESVQEWQEAGQDDSYLLPAGRVDAADTWLERSGVALSDDETRYLDASRRRKQALEAAEADRAAHEEALEKRAVTRMRATIAVLIVGIVVAGGLTAFAFQQRDTAEQQRVAAERAERLATSRGLASAAVAQLGEDPERSVLLGIEAITTTRDVDGDVLPEAEIALRRAIQASRVERRLEGGAAMSIGPDGRLATLSIDGVLRVWDPDPSVDQPLLELEGQSRSLMVNPEGGGQTGMLARVDDIDFSPDGLSIVVTDQDLRGAIRDASTGEILVEMEGQLSRPRFGPDGRYVAAIAPQPSDAPMEAARSMGIWDAETGELLRLLEPGSGNIWAQAFSPDGSRVALATHAGTIELWDVGSGERRWGVGLDGLGLAEGGPALSVAFDPSGEQIAFGGGAPGAVALVDSSDGSLIEAIPRPTGTEEAISGVAFDDAGERLVAVDLRGLGVVWDLEAGGVTRTVRGHTGMLTGAAFLEGGDRIVTASEDDTTRVWDVRVDGGHGYMAVPGGLPGLTTDVARFSPDSRHLATGGLDGVRIWDVAAREQVAFNPTDAPVSVVAYDPDGDLLALASVVGMPDLPQQEWRTRLDVIDLDTGETVASMANDDMFYVADLAFSPDGQTLVSGGVQVVRAFDLATGDERFTYFHEPGLVLGATYAPAGDRLLVIGQDAAVVLDAESGEALYDLLRQETAVVSAAFMDEHQVVLGDLAGRVRAFDLNDGEELRTIWEGAAAATVGVRDELVYISERDAVTARDLRTGERISRIEVPSADLVSFELSPDGRYLATNNAGSWRHLHALQVDDLLDLAHERLTRWWTDAECEEFLQRDCPERLGA